VSCWPGACGPRAIDRLTHFLEGAPVVGYVGLPRDHERLRRLDRLSAGPAGAGTHREDGFAVVLTAPPAERPATTIRTSGIAVTPWHVLAFEGYLADLDPADAREPAAWLLAQHARRGVAAFEHLHGAYVVSLFDRRTREAWMGACSFGRRDLYYLREGEGLLFATDLTGILALAARRPELDTTQMPATFLCGAVYGGATLLTGVRRALPGSLLHVTPTRTTESRPAPLTVSTSRRGRTVREATEELDHGLRVAVARLSRVTEGRTVLMSAGVDSPLAAAYVKSVTGTLNALTLSMGGPLDETERARAIAAVLGGDHHVSHFRLDAIDPLHDMRTFVRIMEEPTSFGLGLPMMTLVRSARGLADGFVCGVSADALFGNPFHNPDDPRPESIFHYVYRELAPPCVHAVVRLEGPDPDEIVAGLRARLPGIGRRQRVRLPLLMQSGLMIRFASRMARSQQAEALFPYLDRDVVALAFGMPATLRRRDKPLLRRLATRHYTIDDSQPRPLKSKVPFVAYPIKWLQAAGRLDPILDLLDEPRTRLRGVYRERDLRQLIETYRRGHATPEWHLVLWQLAVFELFCRDFVDAPAAGHVTGGVHAQTDVH
jgi:asparagine synthetase B (glutamine-hydrolysing)